MSPNSINETKTISKIPENLPSLKCLSVEVELQQIDQIRVAKTKMTQKLFPLSTKNLPSLNSSSVDIELQVALCNQSTIFLPKKHSKTISKIPQNYDMVGKQ